MVQLEQKTPLHLVLKRTGMHQTCWGLGIDRAQDAPSPALTKLLCPPTEEPGPGGKLYRPLVPAATLPPAWPSHTLHPTCAGSNHAGTLPCCSL